MPRKLPKKFTYIYGLVDPREPDHIRYVGKSNNPTRRLSKHIRGAMNYVGHNWPKEHWIRELSREGANPEHRVLLKVGRDHWEYYEKHLIEKLPEKDHELLNITNGGEGTYGMDFTEEHRKNISEGVREAFQDPVVYSEWLEACRDPERRRRISEGNKGKKLSEEDRRKKSDAMKRRIESLEGEDYERWLSEHREKAKHMRELKQAQVAFRNMWSRFNKTYVQPDWDEWF